MAWYKIEKNKGEYEIREKNGRAKRLKDFIDLASNALKYRFKFPSSREISAYIIRRYYLNDIPDQKDGYQHSLCATCSIMDSCHGSPALVDIKNVEIFLTEAKVDGLV